MNPETEKNVQAWLDGPYDEETKAAIRSMSAQERTDAFYKKLEFGTGGLRGIMGVGTNRLNRYTIGTATQGLANYLKSGSVLISYDSRHHSREFAEEAARVLIGNNIKVYIYDKLHPVPLASFGCLHKKCNAAVMITASHNPPEYNGYKVYWSNGAQVLAPHDTGIIEEVDKVKEVKLGSLDEANWIGEEIDNAYLETIQKLRSCPEQDGSKLHIIYTPLHGTGIVNVPPALASWGFSNVSLVDAQSTPDGDFPTVKSPNPEEHEALSIGIEQMRKENADIIIGTDPDCDRVGVAVNHHGKAELLGGNQVACLCLDHLCRKGHLPNNPAVIKTIVTTEMFRKIAETHHIPCHDTLTGFKYIGQLIDEWERTGGPSYLFGGEESYGYLLGTHARDKDAVVSSCLICEVALDAKLNGQTLVDRMDELYETYGVFREKLKSVTYPGHNGAQKMAAIMKHLRNTPPVSFSDIPVKTVEDYKQGVRGFPKSNVLLYRLQDGSKVVIRPSGTEPKIKLYCGVTGNTIEDADTKLDRLLDALSNVMVGTASSVHG